MNTSKIQFDGKGIPLIKITSAKYCKSFVEGKLHAKTLKRYRELEKETQNDSIGDLFEGLLHIQEGYMIIPEENITVPLNDILIPTKSSDDFVFCMFSITDMTSSFSFSSIQQEKLLSFGDTAVIILDSDEFIRRVHVAAEKEGYMCNHNMVNYYNPNEDYADIFFSLKGGTHNMAFWKRDKYSYQQEFRFVFSPGNGEDSIEFDIGDISDISITVPLVNLLTASVVKNN